MVLPTKTPQGSRLNPQNTLELSQGMDIQVAVNTANAHGGEWTILLYPGAPYRQGDITHVGVANITIASMGHERAVIAPTVAPVAGVIVSGAILTLDGVDVIAPDATMPALRVTGGTCTCIGNSEFRFVGAGGDAIQQVAGILTFDHCVILTGDIDLSGSGCTLNMYFCRLVVDPIDTAGAFAHQITLEHCDLNGQNINSAATGATVISMAGCTNVGVLAHAGTGAVTLRGSEVASINMIAAGTVVAYGGYIGAITRAAGSVVWWLDDSTIKVLPSATITDGVIGYALVAAAAGGITINIAHGTYEEDSLVVPDDVQIVGEGKNFSTQIIINSVNDVITFGNVTAGIRRVGITQNGAAEAIVINNAGADVIISDCNISALAARDAIQMTAGSATIRGGIIVRGDIDLSTAACTLDMHMSCIHDGDIVTAGAFDHVVTLISVDMNNNNITNGATGATTIIFEKCIAVNAFTDASLLGTVLIETTVITTATKTGTSPWTVRVGDFGVLSNTNPVGAITCYGGLTYSLARAIGPIVIWENSNTLHVKPCTTITDTIIQWAVAAAGAGDVIIINPGTYEEAVVLTAGINLKGIDKEACIINIDHAVLITMAEGCSVSSLSLDVTCDATNVGTGIELNDAACTIEDVNIVLHRSAGLYATGILESTGATARTINIRNVRCSMSDDSNERGIAIEQAGKTVYIENSWIQGSDYGLAIGESAGVAVASTIYTTNSHFEATSAIARSVFNNGGTIRMNNDSIGQADHTGGRVLCENGGVVTYKVGPNSYEVWEGMDINHADGAGRYIFLHPGAYAYTANVSLSAGVTLEGSGAGNTTLTFSGAAITNGIVMAGDDIVVRSLEVVLAAGVGAGGSKPNGIYATGRTRLLLEEVWVTGDSTVGDDGSIVRQNGICWDTCTYSTVTGCKTYTTKRNGICLSTTTHSEVSFNQCTTATYHGILIALDSNNTRAEGNDSYLNTIVGLEVNDSHYCNVTGNHTESNGTAGIHLSSSSTHNTFNSNQANNNIVGLDLCSGDYNVATGNHCYNNSGQGINIAGNYITVAGNQCDLNDGGNIYSDGSDYVSITGNQCTGDNVAIVVFDGANAEISGNTCTGGVIRVSSMAHSSITGNTIIAAPAEAAIEILASDYCSVTGNHCFDFAGYGIYVFRSSYCNIEANECDGDNNDGTEGIYIKGDATAPADYNFVHGNTCVRCVLIGYEISGGANANHNRIIDNEVDTVPTYPFYDNGDDTEWNHIAVPFSDGTEPQDSGFLIDAGAEYARAWLILPKELQFPVKMKVYARSVVAEADKMRLELVIYGAAGNEVYTTHNGSVANHPSTSLNFGADDIIFWEIDEAGVLDLREADSVQVKVLHEDAANGDCQTNAYFRTVELEYI